MLECLGQFGVLSGRLLVQAVGFLRLISAIARVGFLAPTRQEKLWILFRR